MNNSTPLETFRLVVASFGLWYVLRGAHQMWRDYVALHGNDRTIARLNRTNSIFRTTAMFGMWSVSLLAVLFDSFPGGWVIYSQAAYTVVILCMVAVAVNIRRAQKYRPAEDS